MNLSLADALKNLEISSVDFKILFQKALSRGGDLAEFFFEDKDATRIVYEGSRAEKIEDGRDRGCGLRILFDGRSVYGYTTDLSQASLENLAESLSSAVHTQKAKKPLSQDWRVSLQKNNEILNYEIKKSPRQVAIDEKLKICERVDQEVRRLLPEVTQVTVYFLDSYRKILTVNSDGLFAPDHKTYLQLYTEVVAEKDGKTESAVESDGGYVGMEFFDSNPPENFAKEAVKRVKTLLSAKPAPSGTMPVVMAAEAGGTMIHEAVGHGLEADLACNGLSVYQNKVGKQVASPLITVVDDGTMPEKRGSFAYDDEGTPSQKNVLIENGVLKGYMVDKISAMKFDLPATGNGRRESFRHKPIVRMTNTYIAPGKDDPESILKDTSWGVYVKSMGGGQVNTVTGDFVFAVTEGYLIRDGKIAEPIRGATLVGNGPKALSLVDRVGNDLGFSTGTCGKDGQGAPVTDAQPTLRIPELTVGGEVSIDHYWKK